MATLTLTPKGFRASLPSGLPDLVVQSVSMTPSAPNTGDHVVFSAVVKNQGSGPTPSSTGIGLLFSIDGAPVNWTTDTQGSLAAGQTRTLTATAGVSGGNWWVAADGTHTLLANVNDTLSISETVTVNNTLSSNVAVTTASSPPPSGGVVYGPDGTEWAPDTPTWTGSFDVTVGSVAALNTALGNVTTAQASAKTYRIGLLDGEYAGSAQAVISEHAALAAATGNVLVASVNKGGATFAKGVSLLASHVTLAYIQGGGGSMRFDGTPKNSWYARCRFLGTTNIIVSGGGSNCGIVGVICPDGENTGDGTTTGDRLHISPDNGSAGPGPSMTNFTVDHSWLSGMRRTTGSTNHCDAIQIDGLYGIFTIKNTYSGPAPSNGNPQAKADIFDGAAPFCTIVATDTVFAGSYIDGQGNASNASGPHRATRCVFYDVSSSMAFRYNQPLYTSYQGSTQADTVLTDCVFYGSINTGRGGTSGLTNTNPTFKDASLKTSAKPALVKPPWAWW